MKLIVWNKTEHYEFLDIEIVSFNSYPDGSIVIEFTKEGAEKYKTGLNKTIQEAYSYIYLLK